MAVKGGGRSSNIELLRIVAMLMIIIYHINLHCVSVQMNGGDYAVKIGNGAMNHPVFYTRVLLLNMISPWGQIGNGIFLIISGYFMLSKGKNIDIGKISKKLLTQLGFAAVALVVASALLFACDGGEHFFYLVNITMFNGMSWYVGYYYIVMLIAALYLNNLLAGLDRNKFSEFLIVFFALISFSWSAKVLEGLGAGMCTVATGVFFYSLGGYIRKYDPFGKVRAYVLFLIIFAVYGFIYLSIYNTTQTNIENYNIANPDGGAAFSQSVIGYGNNSIIVIAVAVCMFEIFRRIKLPHSALVNFLGQGTFMVYLMHDNAFFYSIWGTKDWIKAFMEKPKLFPLELLKCAAATFAAGMAVYALYLLVMKALDKGKWIFIKK